jgi:hypothetical protein
MFIDPHTGGGANPGAGTIGTVGAGAGSLIDQAVRAAQMASATWRDTATTALSTARRLAPTAPASPRLSVALPATVSHAPVFPHTTGTVTVPPRRLQAMLS